MEYTVSYQHAGSQVLSFSLQFTPNTERTSTEIRMSAWRPGRYELGNFTRFLKTVYAFDEQGNSLSIQKVTRESWIVEHPKNAKITIKYDYFAGLLNAGSTFLNQEQVYLNPVNCLLYVPEQMHEQCSLLMEIPDHYQIATGLEVVGKTLNARNYEQLADCPIIASASLIHHVFDVQQLKIHLWFQGECKPDLHKLEIDFSKFINVQIDAFGEFPEKDYHFLFQITPNRSYHGVEHENSTVCMLGPTYYLMTDVYDDLLGLSSHEFYHSWNIKKIRPVEMLPYDYTQPNYFRTGFVAEGATTYYGDLMLFRGKTFSQKQFFTTIEESLQKHFHNYGRFNMPVSEASFDAWVDGYEPGVPHRKTSIYTEGALFSMMVDIEIIFHSKGKYSLDNVMYDLYHEFAKKDKGYTTKDVQLLMEKYAGISLQNYFDNFIVGCNDFQPALEECLQKVGLKLKISPSTSYTERFYGFKVIDSNNRVAAIAPNSPAELAGFALNDVIISVNQFTPAGNVQEWFKYFHNEELKILLNTGETSAKYKALKAFEEKESVGFYPSYTLVKADELTEEQKQLFTRWTSNELL